MNKAIVYAINKNVAISPKKVRPVMDIVRGANVKQAKTTLTFNNTKAAKEILKTLNSALANAKSNLDLKEENLYISDLRADEGLFRRKARIVAMARVSSIIKRTTHITVGLSERNK
jgi:large subunit ribosomal protein L22